MKPLCLLLVGLLTLCSVAQLSAVTVTNLNDSGPGSLRAALAADSNIEFTVTGTILLTSGQLEVNRSVTITGPGAEHLAIVRSSMDGTPEFRVFLVRGAPVTISGLTIKNGLVGQTYDSGAGIRNEGTLTLNDCVVLGNRSTGEYTRGTGLFNAHEAILTANRCRFTGNIGTGDYAEGGGIYVFGLVNLNDTTFSSNRGDGHYSRGGGMHVDYFGRAGVSRCTFSANRVAGSNAQGGGIYNYGRLEIGNSTLSGNDAGGSGGGLHVDALAPNTAIRNCTISGNTAPAGAGLANFGMSQNSSTPRTVKDSIIAGNSSGDLENAGILTSSGHNLFGLLSGNPISPGPSDHFGLTADALRLGELNSNGGPTLTLGLLAGSPAIDAGSEAGFPATDQRGVARPFGSRPDIGAFELDVILPPLVTVSATQSNTTEMGPTIDVAPGVFTISRSGGTNEPLQVFYRLSGAASNGVDYHHLSNSVVIPAGQSSAELLVLAFFDGLVEGTEKAVLHLESPACLPIYPPPPDCYVIGPSAEAIVNIYDYNLPTNRPPTITFFSPSNGYTSTAPANIMLIAKVNDPDGVAANATVEFFSGTNKIGNGQLFDPGPPHEAYFRFYWTNVPAGEYTLTARVKDEKGGTAGSDPRHVIVRGNPAPNHPPVVQINSPAPGQFFRAPAEIQLVAYAEDPEDGNDLKVEFFTGDHSLGFGTFVPSLCPSPFCPSYTLIWSNVPPGQYTLTARATDSNAATTVSAPVTIIVYDVALSLVTIRATDASATEAGDSGTFTVSREGNTNSTLHVFYSIGGTAANGVDYVALSNSVLLAAGVQTTTIQITPVEDALLEGTERVELRLLPPPFYLFPYLVGSLSNAVVNIADNDDAPLKPVVTIEAADATASEAPGNPGQFKIRRSGPTNSALSIFLAISGTASNGVDYARITNRVVLPAGHIVAELPVFPINDNLFEGTETIIASLYYPPIVDPFPFPYTIGSPSNATVTILDNDPPITNLPPVVRIHTPTNETTFTAPANILVCTTPSDGDEYVATVEFFAGDTSLGIQTNTCIPPECIHILPETFCLMWSNVTAGNYTLTAKATDNHGASSVSPPVHISVFAPPKPVVTIEATDPTASETPGNPGQFRIQRTGPTNQSLQLSWALTGSASNGLDYAWLTNKVIIPAGRSAVELVITPIDDALYEGTESVVATLYYPPVPGPGVFPYVIGTPSNAVVTILDNDEPLPKPVVTIEATDPTASETAGNPGQFRIQRTGPTNQTLQLYLAVSGSASNGVDYVRLTNIVTLLAGRSAAELVVTPIDDNVVEVTETVVATLYYPPIAGPQAFPYVIGSPSNAIVTIADNDEPAPKPVVTIEATDSTASETPGNSGQFRLHRSGPTNLTLQVYLAITGSASNGVDCLKITNLVTIPAGKTAVELGVSPVDDNLAEGSETVVATLYFPPIAVVFPYNIGSPSNATVTILDNDPSVPPFEPAVVTIEATDPQARETGPLTVVEPGLFTIRRTGNTNPTLHVQCVIGGTASNGVDYISLSNIVIIPSGKTSVLVPVYPINDNHAEGTETVTLHLQNPACIAIYPPPPECYVVGTPGAATAYITDVTESNSLPVVTITASDPIASEGTNCFRWVGWSNPPPASFCGTNTATFVVRRTGNTNTSLSIAYEIGGTASNGVDYAALPGNVTIPAGSRVAEIRILPTDDAVRERSETVVLALTALPGSLPYVIGIPRRAGAVIADNDQPRPTTGPLPDRGFHLMRPGSNGSRFRIECSTNLIHWTVLCTNVVTDGAIHFVDPDAAESSSRFYRAVLEPNQPAETNGRPVWIGAQESN